MVVGVSSTKRWGLCRLCLYSRVWWVKLGWNTSFHSRSQPISAWIVNKSLGKPEVVLMILGRKIRFHPTVRREITQTSVSASVTASTLFPIWCKTCGCAPPASIRTLSSTSSFPWLSAMRILSWNINLHWWLAWIITLWIIVHLAQSIVLVPVIAQGSRIFSPVKGIDNPTLYFNNATRTNAQCHRFGLNKRPLCLCRH